MLNQILNLFQNFGVIEWSLMALVGILLLVILVYNKGVLKCQTKLEDYEKEIKEKQNEVLKIKGLYSTLNESCELLEKDNLFLNNEIIKLESERGL